MTIVSKPIDVQLGKDGLIARMLPDAAAHKINGTNPSTAR